MERKALRGMGVNSPAGKKPRLPHRPHLEIFFSRSRNFGMRGRARHELSRDSREQCFENQCRIRHLCNCGKASLGKLPTEEAKQEYLFSAAALRRSEALKTVAKFEEGVVQCPVLRGEADMILKRQHFAYDPTRTSAADKGFIGDSAVVSYLNSKGDNHTAISAGTGTAMRGATGAPTMGQ